MLSQVRWDVAEQAPGIGEGSEHTACLHLAHHSLVPVPSTGSRVPMPQSHQRPLFPPLYHGWLSLSSLPRAAGSQSIASSSEACFCSRHLPRWPFNQLAEERGGPPALSHVTVPASTTNGGRLTAAATAKGAERCETELVGLWLLPF